MNWPNEERALAQWNPQNNITIAYK